MFLWSSLVIWFFIALLTARLLLRFGYRSESEQPFILLRYGGFAFVPPIYMLVTLLVVIAAWRQSGWPWGIGAFVAASYVFTWIRDSAWKSAFAEYYARLTATTRHTVQPWNTVQSIASSHGITGEEITSANGLSVTAEVQPGQELVIPGRTPDAARQLTLSVIHERSFAGLNRY